ncbi:hypothetical protein Xen7305DRAFT_00012620 [Xenococcus sp. PCC 7305]|nr:hypothetical protein Xen7305DRAFT_00012620 [Xenococcus sp. PCC 7305]
MTISDRIYIAIAFLIPFASLLGARSLADFQFRGVAPLCARCFHYTLERDLVEDTISSSRLVLGFKW